MMIDIDRFLRYLRANGIVEQPLSMISNGTLVAGYDPPPYLLWRRAGAPDDPERPSSDALVVGVNLINIPRNVLLELQQFFGLVEMGESVKWEDLDKPQAIESPLSLIGVQTGPNRYTHNGGVLLDDGTRYKHPDGRVFQFHRSGIFGGYWELLQ